ncbi:MAG: hypothetical protein JXR96_20270 [Deltaproteobacteria bacterium]|nr:hypothetical protein [Deltaproteobacteria bacterium]
MGRFSCGALLGLAVLHMACADSRYPKDDRLDLSCVQARGTHNSYHLEPADPLDPSLRYAHLPLGRQLEEQGVRQLELDLHLRTGEGFEVFHLPAGLDEETTCLRFTDCLAEIRAWSDANRDHLPLMIWLEPKDQDMDWADPALEAFVGRYDGLEEEILSVFEIDRILTPDELRGEHADLPGAIAADGWPSLGRVRGRVLFAMLDSGEHRSAYTDGAPALQGRLMFVDADDADDPAAAVFKLNNPVSDADEIRALVRAGFLVTASVDGIERTDEENQARLDAALSSGVHFLSSDLPAPVVGRDYFLEIPGGTLARCNPVSAPADCRPEDLEDGS